MRNLGIILAFCWAVLPTNGLALGLGEITVNSFLNQPLDAEIEVISARPGEIDDLIVTLASQEAFARAGLTRSSDLSDLRFEVLRSEDGESAVILVRTQNGVKEPFLNFLVDADWQKGRVLREFTVLLDPPFFAEQPAPVETVAEPTFDAATGQPADDVMPAPIADTAASGGSQQPQPIASQTSQAAPPPDNRPSQGSLSPGGQTVASGDIAISKGDTLWGVASRYLDADHSMSQVMLAFQRANPRAFNNGNINNLREGAILRAPTIDEIEALSKQEAYAEVLVQNGLWDEYVARVGGVSPAVAGDGSDAGGVVAADDASGELSLLVPGDGDSDAAGGGNGVEIDRLRTQLAIAEEELDAARIENRELESRIAELQARLSKIEELQKMVEIEDDSLAQLQADQAADPVAQDNVNEAIRADEEALVEELLAEEAAAQAVEQGGADPMVDDAMGTDDMTDDVMETDPMTDDAMTDDAMAEESQPQVAPPAPVIVTQPVTREPSIFDGILPQNIIDMIPSMPALGGLFDNPIVLGAIGGVAILLILLMFLRRRGKSDEDAPLGGDGEDLFASDTDEELTPIHLAESESDSTDIKVPSEEDLFEAVEADKAASTIVEDDFGSTAIISADDMPDAEEAPAAAPAGEPDQDDVLNEVDVYLAYGLYDNAEDLLRQNLAENPDRADYRSKLLDTYFATKKAAEFSEEAETLKSMGEPANRYWDRVQVMGYELAPDNPLFSEGAESDLSAADLEIAKPQEADFDLGATGDDATNFSTTDFNLGEEDTGSDFMATAAISEVGEAGQISETEQIPQLDEIPDLDDDDDTNLRVEPEPEAEDELNLPDEIGGELEFSMDEGDDEGLPGDLDLGIEGEIDLDEGDADELGDLEMAFDDDGDDTDSRADPSEVDLTGEFEVDLDEDADEDEILPMAGLEETDEDSVEIDMAGFDSEDDTAFAETAVIAPDTAVISPDFGKADTAGEDDDDDATSLLGDELNLETGVIKLPTDDDLGGDDEEDISVVDFGDDDFTADIELEEDGEVVQTGTFAPGDFDEPTGETDLDGVDDLDDISELMMPDDVDEVSTKLDLARAFIDMGDSQGARGSLEEVMAEGNDEQKAEAKALLDQI